MGAGVPRQCSRNRCLARWTGPIPHRGPEGEQVEATPRTTWTRPRSEVFVPFRMDSRAERLSKALDQAELLQYCPRPQAIHEYELAA
jgi:hypothetical protein